MFVKPYKKIQWVQNTLQNFTVIFVVFSLSGNCDQSL